MLDEFGRKETLDALAHFCACGMEVLALLREFFLQTVCAGLFFLPFVPRFLIANYKPNLA